MAIARLAHYSVRTRDLQASRRFYVDVLGLREGFRPPFDFPGIWLYADEADDFGAVHLIGAGGGLEAYLGKRAPDASNTGPLDHLAFAATDWPSLRKRLERHKVPYEERTVPLLGLLQVFVLDPNGIVLELNCRDAHAAG
jgi:catechol 2,3-dioxygenase-like lactoylglutathione lyase family enzyme